MKMKNVLMILVILAVVFAMAGAVSGGKTISSAYDEDRGSTILNFTVQDSYVVVIPSDVSFNKKLYNVQEVNVTTALIQPGWYLYVKLNSGNYTTGESGFKLVNEGSYIPYIITNETGDEEITENDVTILTVASGTDHPQMSGTPVRGYGIGGVMELNFSTTDDYIGHATKSGDHRDTLTFTLDVVNPSQQN